MSLGHLQFATPATRLPVFFVRLNPQKPDAQQTKLLIMVQLLQWFFDTGGFDEEKRLCGLCRTQAA